MATDALTSAGARAALIARGAADWRDPSSAVRAQARSALADGMWPPETAEIALDNALWDLDEARAAELVGRSLARSESALLHDAGLRVLVILPGNIVGPAIQAAYCAAIAGARVTLKAASSERLLAAIVCEQFARLGGPLAATATATYWPGGDTASEARHLESAQRVIVFGEDATIDQVSRRAPKGVRVIGYGDSYSIAYVAAAADAATAAGLAARDVCLFDQRGCMSPHAIYVGGDTARAVLFARTLAREIERLGRSLPRAAFEPGEQALVADTVRRLAASALEPLPHGLDTLIRGPVRDGVPEFVVAVEPFGPPSCAGFGRIVVVKPCSGARDLATQLKYYGRSLDTIGVSGEANDSDRSALRAAGARRFCELGEMQRPPFGYRPYIEDFLA